VGAVADHLQYDSTLNNLKGLPSSYDPNRQFLMRYAWKDELDPHGLSGAAVWCSRKRSSGIWTPDPVPFGVILAYIRKLEVLIAANLSSVLKLLSRI